MPGKRVVALGIAAITIVPGAGADRTASAQTSAMQAPLEQAAIVEHLGAPIPTDLRFRDESGRAVRLGDLLGGRPVLLTLAYFNCPMLCPLEQQGVADALARSGWGLGRDFRAVTVSIDPADTPAVAREWRARAASRLSADPERFDWHYLVGAEPEIRQLSEAVGFRYARDPASGQFSHAAALFVIGTDGRINQYLYGITFDPQTIASALTAAQTNSSRGSVERFLLRCFHYVPALRQHGGAITWILRLGGLFVSGSLALGIVVLWRRERRRNA